MRNVLYFIFIFYLFIYPPDSQESDGGAIHRAGNYPDLLIHIHICKILFYQFLNFMKTFNNFGQGL